MGFSVQLPIAYTIRFSISDLDEIEGGGLKEIRAPDESHLWGVRIALGGAAKQRGFKLDYRTDGSLMVVRRSTEALKPRKGVQSDMPGTAPRKRGRPPKRQAAGVTSADGTPIGMSAEGLSETME